MISLLIYILAIALIAVLGFWIINQIGLEPPIRMIVVAIFALVLLLVLLSLIAPLPGIHAWGWR